LRRAASEFSPLVGTTIDAQFCVRENPGRYDNLDYDYDNDNDNDATSIP